jgi:predicted GNAT family N-acyltransferase
MLKIIETQFQTAIYCEMVDLRYRVLREPLGLQFTKEQLEAEQYETHIAATLNETVVGCVLVAAYDGMTAKLRQMAVEPSYQGTGIGKALLENAEYVASRSGFRKIILHARKGVVAFYKQAGYSTVGKPFIEVTIPHFRMEKFLQ